MMIDGGVQSVGAVDFNNNDKKVYLRPSGESFEAIFNAAIGLINDTSRLQLNAENLQLDYVTGKTDDIIGLNMAQSKASASLQFTAQITNKILAAYQEIMRMSL